MTVSIKIEGSARRGKSGRVPLSTVKTDEKKVLNSSALAT